MQHRGSLSAVLRVHGALPAAGWTGAGALLPGQVEVVVRGHWFSDAQQRHHARGAIVVPRRCRRGQAETTCGGAQHWIRAAAPQIRARAAGNSSTNNNARNSQTIRITSAAAAAAAAASIFFFPTTITTTDRIGGRGSLNGSSRTSSSDGDGGNGHSASASASTSTSISINVSARKSSKIT